MYYQDMHGKAIIVVKHTLLGTNNDEKSHKNQISVRRPDPSL